MSLPTTTTANNGILTTGLTKSYGKSRAVDSLNLNVAPGEFFGFLGPNGAGKTTTIRMLCGLLTPTSGRAEVAGFDILSDSLKIRGIVGLLPESSGFYNWMNAREYLLHFASLYGIEEQEAERRAKELLDKTGLTEKSYVPIGYYSRGMKQRLALARTLINEPRIVFLDEPTLGLDPRGQQDIQRILLELNRAGTTIFLSSHALSDVSSLCDRVAIVNRGRLVAQGTLDELRKLAGGSKGLLVRVVNSETSRQRISAIPYHFETKPDGSFIEIVVAETEGTVSEIVSSLESQGLMVQEVLRHEMTLEEVFFNLTEKKNAVGESTQSIPLPAQRAEST